MLRESEIANFLDLIKHITQARNFNSLHSPQKHRKKHRYQETEYDPSESRERKLTRKSQEDFTTKDNSKLETQFEHKMLKITHDIKRKPRSFKATTLSQDVQFASEN